MNLQFITGVYDVMLTYLTYLCKPEHEMSELRKRHQRRLMEKILKVKWFLLVIHF